MTSQFSRKESGLYLGKKHVPMGWTLVPDNTTMMMNDTDKRLLLSPIGYHQSFNGVLAAI